MSNNGKRFVVPLRLINRADDLDAEEKNKQFTKHCAKEGSRFFPYECEIKFDDGSGAPEVNTVFKTFPNFDFNLGMYFFELEYVFIILRKSFITNLYYRTFLRYRIAKH